MFTQKGHYKYNCEKCDYHSNKMSHWKRHISTGKHAILTGTYKKGAEPTIFFCDCGRSYTHRQSLHNHRKNCECPKILTECPKILTNDNKMVKNDNKMVKNDNKMVTHRNDKNRYECSCGKSYKFISGFSRHKKTCVFVNEKNDESKNNDESTNKDQTAMIDLLKTLLCENQKLQDQLFVKTITPNISNNTINQTNNTNTNSHNKIINVQLFLSEKCADAMSIQHFAKQLEVTLDDVCKSKKDCITNVVLKNLQPLSLTERPFHCTNSKNKEWYIKDEKEGWEEDSGEKLIKNAEDGIMKKWIGEFESRYPKWMENDQQQEKYVQIVGSTTSELPEKTKLKLLRELAGEVPLTKQDMS